MSTAQQQQGIDMNKLAPGLYCLGEYLGIEERESKGKMYYKMKLLVGDLTKKFDIKPDEVIRLRNTNPARMALAFVSYYEFTGQFGTNSVLNTVNFIR
jgi:hypothetical protein